MLSPKEAGLQGDDLSVSDTDKVQALDVTCLTHLTLPNRKDPAQTPRGYADRHGKRTEPPLALPHPPAPASRTLRHPGRPQPLQETPAATRRAAPTAPTPGRGRQSQQSDQPGPERPKVPASGRHPARSPRFQEVTRPSSRDRAPVHREVRAAGRPRAPARTQRAVERLRTPPPRTRPGPNLAAGRRVGGPGHRGQARSRGSPGAPQPATGGRGARRGPCPPAARY